MDSTSINISNSSSASFTLPSASSLNISGVDGETVDIRASNQLLSDSIWFPAYIPDLMVLELFILSQWTHEHVSFLLSCQENDLKLLVKEAFIYLNCMRLVEQVKDNWILKFPIPSARYKHFNSHVHGRSRQWNESIPTHLFAVCLHLMLWGRCKSSESISHSN